jgi:hypothetical protein
VPAPEQTALATLERMVIDSGIYDPRFSLDEQVERLRESLRREITLAREAREAVAKTWPKRSENDSRSHAASHRTVRSQTRTVERDTRRPSSSVAAT